ncbi:Lrp/AsnC family transcriptional regulator [Aeromicrobium sp. IC_218]|uniref:Lrp/AsnC family transcriptional regulator n=1 Tax=Aeromicrobium sp. IC_218 TaxID=2545468 RepID=UPI0010401818|nr:Lrp/AsnC family transcriptional regulator [Aeromicrobium sp. IC_218]TCI98936.1 hypothetical protein E0W78_09340 [Aeromicrobium sp. IC_218]
MELDDAILHALADGGREPQLVAEAVGAPLDDVRARLSILEAAGAVVSVELPSQPPRQQYRLTASAD